MRRTSRASESRSSRIRPPAAFVPHTQLENSLMHGLNGEQWYEVRLQVEVVQASKSPSDVPLERASRAPPACARQPREPVPERSVSEARAMTTPGRLCTRRICGRRVWVSSRASDRRCSPRTHCLPPPAPPPVLPAMSISFTLTDADIKHKFRYVS